MSRRCDLTDLGIQTGNNVSHSHRKTRRRYLPNLQKVHLYSEVLGRDFNLRVAARTLRSVEHNGGLDGFLTGASDRSLSDQGRKIKAQIKKAQAAAA